MSAGIRLGVAQIVSMLTIVGAASAAGAGCGGDDGSTTDRSAFPGGGDAGSDDAASIVGNQPSLKSIAIDPPSATIESVNSAAVAQTFKAVAVFDDGTKSVLAHDVEWFATDPQVGAIDAKGLYTASGSIGGAVQVRATYKSQKATASLTVKLHLQQNPGSVPGSVQGQLANASKPDPSVVWAYPYDGTVWPRGLSAPLLMWNGGAASDAIFVHVKNGTFELEEFTSAANAPSARVTIDPTTWQKLTDSSAGPTQLTVARWDGSAATVLAQHTWTIAPASMRGTIYYWSNNLGRVLRIKPGAAQPDDFLAAAGVNGCSTCHAVSADGSTLVIGGDVATSTFDLKGNKPTFSGMGRAWAQPALTPDGKYLVENSSPLPGPPGGSDGLFYTANGQRVPSSGLDGYHMGMPAFAPDGTRLVYRDESGGPTPGSLRTFDFDPKAPKASNDHELIKPGANASLATIGFPSVSPDAKWIVYERGTAIDTRAGNSDLYIASATTPNQETRLSKVDGDGYPFAAGARDLQWNFEPSFAPVAAGGYFWVVFTSRRTYGNVLTGDKTVVKQLWVAAIDQNPQSGQDPSHAAFHLTGQDEQNFAMRGFWALDPCKGDGQGCSSGTECCGGYCDAPPDGGGPVCMPQSLGCSQDGDKCNQTSDCCNAPSGVTCINHVCSEPTPK